MLFKLIIGFLALTLMVVGFTALDFYEAYNKNFKKFKKTYIKKKGYKKINLNASLQFRDGIFNLFQEKYNYPKHDLCKNFKIIRCYRHKNDPLSYIAYLETYKEHTDQTEHILVLPFTDDDYKNCNNKPLNS